METNDNAAPQETSATAVSVFARIEREQISPRPRWHFLAREGVVWTLGVVSVGVGALAVAGTLFELRNTWWGVYEATHESFVDFGIDALPYVWLAVFCIFAYSAHWSLLTTKRGYRYSFVAVVVGSLAVTGAAGTGLFVLGAGRMVDEQVGAYIPFHRPLSVRERSVWLLPTEGRLAGIVREVPFTESMFWIEGVNGDPYRVFMDIPTNDRAHLRVGEQVRIAGIPTTTAGVLEGCIVFIHDDDVLRDRAQRRLGMDDRDDEAHSRERKTLFSRNTWCRNTRPYARLVPQEE